MKSNGLLKWLMIPMALLLVFVGLKLFSGSRPASKVPRDADPQLAPSEMKALGIEGDTPRDTVATLVAQVKQLRTELQTALSDNKNQRAENERMRQRESNVDQRIQSALESERGRLQQDREQVASERQQAQGVLQELQRRLDGMSKKGNSDMPIGLGLEDDAGQVGGARDGGATRWVEPTDAKPTEASKGTQFPTTFAPAQKKLEVPEGAPELTGKATAAKAVYTVPSNATLMGSTAMTALIGRVPVDGTVNDPYPFKVIVGADNLTANGIDLPDVAGAVISGTSSGDWTLSCVRGQIRSITFVFQDGTIRTVPEDGRSGGDSATSAGSGTGQGGLGWISDPHGIPCVTGERRSNAQEYLGSQALITAAGAGAASLAKPGGGSVSVISNGSSSLGSLSANEAMGRILSSGVQDMSQWVNKLYGQAFAAIYVEPGAKVAVHLEKSLHIDFDPRGRKVDHRIGATDASLSLD